MERASDFFDAWLKLQRGFIENWLETTKKIQQSFSNTTGFYAGPPQFPDFFNPWFTIMLNTSKAFTEWVVNLQNLWRTMIEKQMEISKEITEQFFKSVIKAEEIKKE
jgi:hypothetical protein